jgi:hypothetical protein
MLEIVDTFPRFLAYWEKSQGVPLDVQIDRWAEDYLFSWPDLLALQIDDYREQNIDWREIASQKIFPALGERLPAMQAAHANLLAAGESIYRKTLQTLEVNIDALFVIHVGIGCGAGWVTKYNGRPAILFGLDNIAESGWHEPEAISGLIAHEFGHLVHFDWREGQGRVNGSGPWWQLYEEGFAQYCERLLLELPSWHQMHSDEDWLRWCQAKRSWLAGEFIRRVNLGEAITPFFGSWFDLLGRQETGYFLGGEAVQRLASEFTLQEIALLDDFELVLRPILKGWAEESSKLKGER